MPSAQPFRFKQFTIQQSDTVFKVGTDAVLLGAWTDVKHKKTIADLGCGTGVISLMLAQRNPHAQISAMDISDEACSLTKMNFKNSLWGNQMKVIKEDLMRIKSQEQYDAIVSNPPYFQKSFKPNSKNNMRSKHDLNFNFDKFYDTINKITKLHSTASFILPYQESLKFQLALTNLGFKPIRKCNVHTTPYKDVERVLIEFQKTFVEKEVKIEKIVIQNSGKRHDYTDAFVALTKKFYTIL